MTNIEMPTIVGEIGNMKFKLSDGSITKSFYAAADFNAEKAVFPILNESNEVVEYMDILGNFTKGTTGFAKAYYDYCISIVDVPYIRMQHINLMYTGLVDFPSRYLADENVKKLIIKEEKRRFWFSLKNGLFHSLLEVINYKKYVDNCLKTKLEKAKIYKEQTQKQSENTNE